MNYSFILMPAWDNASDTRGYSIGFTTMWMTPAWKLAFGSYQVPTTANGINLDPRIERARGDNLELTLRPNDLGTAIRFLVYHNQGCSRELPDGDQGRRRPGSAPQYHSG